jgi:hypothetical protein
MWYYSNAQPKEVAMSSVCLSTSGPGGNESAAARLLKNHMAGREEEILAATRDETFHDCKVAALNEAIVKLASRRGKVLIREFTVKEYGRPDVLTMALAHLLQEQGYAAFIMPHGSEKEPSVRLMVYNN